jgi:protocatechuate 3,4-dioxygenase beta subunit
MMRSIEKSHHALILSGWTLCVGLLSFVAGYGQQSQPAATSAPVRSIVKEPIKDSISGEVVDETGHPLMNAAVMVIGTSGERATKSEATDENGKFMIRDLQPGAYRLQARAPAYVQDDISGQTPDGTPHVYRTGEHIGLTLSKGGVITGTVTDQSGNAIVGVNVTAIRIRQFDEPNVAVDSFGSSRMTDDRGIYRLYGLRPGRYFVYAGAGSTYGRPGPYDKDAATYYPSSNRDTASVVNIQTGQEATGIDIRYRGERGFSASGSVTGSVERFVMLSLVLTGNPTPVASSSSQEVDGRNVFAFSNLVNGDYKVIAYMNDVKSGRVASGTTSVSIKNGDVEGLVVKLSPLAAISGRVVVTPSVDAKCEASMVPGPEQVVLAARPEKRTVENPYMNGPSEVSAQPTGEFRITGLLGGNYRLRSFLPTDETFIKSIDRVRPQAGVTARSNNTSPESVALADGESLSGLTINAAGGGGSAYVRVDLTGFNRDDPIVPHLFLVPSEKDRADDTLRFAESSVSDDGAFAFRNLAPGKYFLISRTLKDTRAVRPLYWDARERLSMLADGVAGGLAVEIKPCQSNRDLAVKLGPNGLIK